MDKKISVVLPVYNISKYLEECVKSLISQKYSSLEIILVDDGSTDGSGEICDKLAQEDSRVVVIHQKNGGAANARNHGIDIATGEYICFVDSDDAVCNEYISHLAEQIVKNDCDIAVCGFTFWFRDSEDIHEINTAEGVYSKEEFLLRFLKDWSCSSLCNKMFRREIISNIRMAEGHCIDDEYFTYRIVMNSRKTVVSHKPLYRYRMRSSSVMHDMGGKQERIMLDRIGYVTQRYKDICENVNSIEKEFFDDAIDTLARYRTHSKNMPIAQKKLQKWVNGHIFRILKMDCSLKQRVAYLYHFYFKSPSKTAEPNPLESKKQVFD